jgi:hypothetical protein
MQPASESLADVFEAVRCGCDDGVLRAGQSIEGTREGGPEQFVRDLVAEPPEGGGAGDECGGDSSHRVEDFEETTEIKQVAGVLRRVLAVSSRVKLAADEGGGRSDGHRHGEMVSSQADRCGGLEGEPVGGNEQRAGGVVFGDGLNVVGLEGWVSMMSTLIPFTVTESDPLRTSAPTPARTRTTVVGVAPGSGRPTALSISWVTRSTAWRRTATARPPMRAIGRSMPATSLVRACT